LKSRIRNCLLSSLGAEDFAALGPHLTRESLETGDAVLKAGDPVERVYFPESGIVSIHDVLGDGKRIGIGILGLEGMAGWPLLLGCRSAPHEAVVAIGGCAAISISASDLLAVSRERRAVNELLLLYVQCFVQQMTRTILSNVQDSVDRRLARWLLMNQDRLGGDEIDLTHEQLGVMLDVRRATVTDTLHILEGEGLIRSLRHRIIIRDRLRLIERAGEAYGPAEKTYADLIGTCQHAHCAAYRCGEDRSCLQTAERRY
jgi:CRP-like cAMP-binding protein